MTNRNPAAEDRGQRVRTRLVRVLSPEHREFERDLLRVAACVPLQHRSAWLERFGDGSGSFCAALDHNGRCLAGFAIDVARSRALPGHQALRVERYCPAEQNETSRAMLECVCGEARRNPRVLGVSVELCCFEEAKRLVTEDLLTLAGFVRSAESRRYEHTLVLDLQPKIAEIFARLDSKARRDIRIVSRHPVEVRPIEGRIWAGRIEELRQESMTRTGGRPSPQDWSARLEFGRTSPHLARTVGLFKTDSSGPESLVAFASALSHGSYVHYDASGATRSSGLRIPMSYALLWDLIQWAKANSAQHFDFGGITLGHLKDGQDALGGISDFKRYFTKNVVQVGAEWVLEPRPFRARVARTVSAAAERIRIALHR